MTASRSWDPDRYLQFAEERSRPFVDLVSRVGSEPRTIVDLGCGPGHLTEVLRARWPDATIVGVDSSHDMIDKAIADNDDPQVSYELADVATWQPRHPAELIISNALFQWVPGQMDVIERLGTHVTPGGTFALQVPNNYSGQSHRLLDAVASQEPYVTFTEGLHLDRGTNPVAYLDLFAGAGWSVDVWETTYLHVLQGEDPVFEWISGTGARPVLQALPYGLREQFTEAYQAVLREAYPRRPWGTVLPFARTFVIARRPR
jgi:trans-aconitate 2-methyltransferase